MHQPNNKRMRNAYSKRDAVGKKRLYAWYRDEVKQQEASKLFVFSSFIYKAFGEDLSNIRVVDVGCGKGEFLRALIEWGASPSKIIGTEFLEDRLEIARMRSPSAIDYHLGGLDFLEQSGIDLAVTNTVFSSILDAEDRQELAQEMWRIVAPGGWIMVFDFRYNNPSNPDVHKVTKSELQQLWNGSRHQYTTLLLAPPLARKIIPISPLFGEILAKLFPFLRSHFVYMVQKPFK